MNNSKYKSSLSSEHLYLLLIIFLFLGYFFLGIKIYKDYTISIDEPNQIVAGHITWETICEHLKLGSNPQFSELPKLEEYENRFYGQAATFPTVLVELINNFSMDISNILRLRHLWNFIMFYFGTICLACLIKHRFTKNKTVLLVVFFYILTPRLFGDAFYNDRDTMLISLFWISLYSFVIFIRKPKIINTIICSFWFGLTINTRLFGLILLLLPLFFFQQSRNKKYFLLLFSLTFCFLYIFTPLYWGKFSNEFHNTFYTFSSGIQRTREGKRALLFFGKYYIETELPFYYLPIWIFISTPLIPQFFTVIGIICIFAHYKKTRINNPLDFFMVFLLLIGIGATIIIHPVLYNGWRHMYFLYMPLYYLSGYGINHILSTDHKTYKFACIFISIISIFHTGYRIINLHPYEYIYLNSIFQSKEDEFERDYWYLATSESLKFLLSNSNKINLDIMEKNDLGEIIVSGLRPNERERFHSFFDYDKAKQQTPCEYIIYNYHNMPGNNISFDYYSPVYTINRDNIKLAEVFQRTHNYELPSAEIVKNISALGNEDTKSIFDSNYETIWIGSEKGEKIIIEFADQIALFGFEIFPDFRNSDFSDFRLFFSSDGNEWIPVQSEIKGTNGFSFPTYQTKWIKIETKIKNLGIRDILFYGLRTEKE